MAHAVHTRTCLVQIDAGNGISIVGSLALPDRARGVVVFAHGRAATATVRATASLRPC